MVGKDKSSRCQLMIGEFIVQDSEKDEPSEEETEDRLQRNSTLLNQQSRAGGQLESLSSRSLSSASFSSARV